MANKNNWNYERYRTRDLLLGYDDTIIPTKLYPININNLDTIITIQERNINILETNSDEDN